MSTLTKRALTVLKAMAQLTAPGREPLTCGLVAQQAGMLDLGLTGSELLGPLIDDGYVEAGTFDIGNGIPLVTYRLTVMGVAVANGTTDHMTVVVRATSWERISKSILWDES